MSREIWTADCETAPFGSAEWQKLVDHDLPVPAMPFIWGVYNGSEYHEFYSTDDFVDWCENKEIIIYAHNGGKFDWHFILHRLEQFEPLTIISGRLAKFKIGECEFRDSYNILPMPLSAWEKDDFDYSILEPGERDKPANKIKISNYLRNDCKYLFEMVEQFVTRYGVNLTLAGSAMKVWQQIADTKAPKTNELFYETLAPFYYGGRVECFKPGITETPFKVVDINSAYPFAMKHAHPYGTNYAITDSLPNSRAYTERAFITVECVSKGAFPYRAQGGLNFPNDGVRRIYTVTGWEWLAALETGTVEDWEILEVLQFSDSIQFDDYIDHFYDMKTEAKQSDDKAGYIFAKLFLNSLYGKFGANPDNYSEYTIVKPRYIEAAEEDGYTFCAEMNKWALVSRELLDEQKRYYNVAVAASITGFVRAYMWRSINQCKGVMYCDTDSIACADTGTLELDPTRLGAWDIEAECDNGAVAGKKLYAFHDISGKWKTASKGVRLSPEQIIKVAEGHTVTYAPQAPSFSLKRGIKFISRDIKKIA